MTAADNLWVGHNPGAGETKWHAWSNLVQLRSEILSRFCGRYDLSRHTSRHPIQLAHPLLWTITGRAYLNWFLALPVRQSGDLQSPTIAQRRIEIWRLFVLDDLITEEIQQRNRKSVSLRQHCLTFDFLTFSNNLERSCELLNVLHPGPDRWGLKSSVTAVRLYANLSMFLVFLRGERRISVAAPFGFSRKTCAEGNCSVDACCDLWTWRKIIHPPALSPNLRALLAVFWLTRFCDNP